MAPVILLAASPDDILVFQLLEETYLPQCCTGHPLGKGEHSGHFITPTVQYTDNISIPKEKNFQDKCLITKQTEVQPLFFFYTVVKQWAFCLT